MSDADLAERRRTDGRAWGCDNTEEGTLHNGAGDLRVDGDGAGDRVQAAAAVAERLAELEAFAREQRSSLKRKRQEEAAPDAADGGLVGGAAADTPDQETLPKGGAGMLAQFFSQLSHFVLRCVADGGSDLQLYDAMRSPDRSLLAHGFFAAEGSLVLEQLLAMPQAWAVVSIIATEQMLSRLAPVLLKADLATTDAPACVVYAGSRAQISQVTSFKHSALSTLAIVRRPATTADQTVAQWLGSLRPVEGMRRPTVLIMDGVSKTENVGALFRSALAFGVSGVLLSPGCADPLYRKSIRASMGSVFTLPFRVASRWPEELYELRGEGGYSVLALHLQGSVELDQALPSPSGIPSSAPPGISASAPLGIMVGAEFEGVSEQAAQAADARVRIAMAPAMQVDSLHGVDSLNVNVAAAIVLERVFSQNRIARP